MERKLLPQALRNFQAAEQRYLQGGYDLDEMELDLSSYEEIIIIHKDAQVRHRRSMLNLNTVIGRRIMP
ncbi:hypothetical protein BH23PLA1_BH23PLA1_33130 [soil metagenome]